MITKDNTSLYANLFEKANALLGLKDTENEIKSIDDYFCHLGDITSRVVAEDGTVSDPLYFILPIDEPVFEIRANKREIIVPEAFKPGVSVKGDEIAETIYFTIDRYFDTTDFYDKNLKAIVQWQNANGDKSISATTAKAVIEDQSEGTVKVIFGWPLSREITEYPGNVTFSVRFYNTLKDENGAEYLEYSFSTLNAVVKINPSLDLDIIDGGFDTVDKNWLIYKRLRNSLPADIDLQAIQPIIDFFIPEVGTEADLDENNKLLVKMKAVYPSGTTASRIKRQKYTLMREDYNGINPVVSAFLDEGVFGEDYIATNDSSMNTTEAYFIKKGETYEPYADPDWVPGLYEKIYTYEVDRAGKYYVVITNYIGESNYADITSGKFEVKLPSEPIIYANNDNDYHGILTEIMDEENVGTGTYNPCTISLLAEDTDAGIPLVYNWYKADNAEGSNPTTLVEKSNNNSYTAEEPGYYFLEAVNERNNAFAIVRSNPIRVTYPAQAADLTYFAYGKYETSAEDLATSGMAVNSSLKIRANAERADEFEYRWYKQGNNAVLSDQDTYTFSESMIGNSYFCEVTSIYNKVSKAIARSVVFQVVAG
jgi:hypothetical protein